MERPSRGKIARIELKNGRVIGDNRTDVDSNEEVVITFREDPNDGPCVSKSSNSNTFLCYIINDLSNDSLANKFKETFKKFQSTVKDCIPSSFIQILENSDCYIGLIVIILSKNDQAENNSFDMEIIDQLLGKSSWTKKPKIFIELKPNKKPQKQTLAIDGVKYSPTQILRYHFNYDKNRKEDPILITTIICDCIMKDGYTKDIRDILEQAAEKIEHDECIECVPIVGRTMGINEQYILGAMNIEIATFSI